MKKNYTLHAIVFAFIFAFAIVNLKAQCSAGCGTGADGVYIATVNTTLAGGTYNYTSFTINAGVVVTVTGTQALIINCTGNIQINGTLNANGGVGGDGVTYSTYGTGGIGTAGGANGGDGVYLGSAALGQNGLGLGAGTGGLGWSGGGGSGFSAVGASSGGGGGYGGPIYGSANLSPLYGGSGGGGGSGGNSCGSGGGGGGGGIIFIQACGSITIGATGQILANGGNGGSDGNGNCGSGAGGSGGSIWLSTTGPITNNGIVNAIGGVGGATTIPNAPYYGMGGTGSVGRIRFDYNSLSGSGSVSPAIGYSGILLGVTITSTGVTCFGGCNGTSSVTASGGTSPYTYSWSPGGGTTPAASGLCAGSYTCTITDFVGCTTTITTTITSPTAIVASISSTNVSCFGGNNGSATVSGVSGGAGAYTYLWSPAGGTGLSATNLTAGSYTCTITDASGCVNTQSTTITQPSAIVANVISTQNLCNGQCTATATANPSGGTSPYTFTNLTSLCAGTYFMTITDANGCTANPSIVITDPSPLVATATTIMPTCNGGCDGSATVSPAGGTPGYSYSWAPVSSLQATVTGLCAGVYTCTITDANGCTTIVTVAISNPAAIVPSVMQNNSPACFGDCNGAATVTATGGSAPYTWLWSPTGCTTQSCTGLCAGTYVVDITDANGCTATISVDITQPTAVIANSSHTNAATPTSNDGTLTGSATGGTPGYTYVWNPGNLTGANQVGLAPGTYTLTACDANNCCDTSVTVIGTISGIAALTNSDFSVNLFPNPATDHIQISVTNSKKGDVKLEVYNLLGERIDQISFGNVNVVDQTYSTSKLESGIYFFRISSGSITTTRKITVAH